MQYFGREEEIQGCIYDVGEDKTNKDGPQGFSVDKTLKLYSH